MVLANIYLLTATIGDIIVQTIQTKMPILFHILLILSGACTGFLKGVGEESARSAGFEATAASEASSGRGPGAQPPENF